MSPTVEEVKALFRPKLKPLEWDSKNKVLILLDQSRLPFEKVFEPNRSPEEVAESIRLMKVRGAPAIGISAGYGMVLALTSSKPESLDSAIRALSRAKEVLDKARPTAVNLSWATSRMLNRARELVESGRVRNVGELVEELEAEANRIYDEELDAEIRMGLYGLEKIDSGDSILTQCNAGGLATGTGLGTALAPVKLAKLLGYDVHVYAPETRPWLQGARLTVYELMEEGVPVTLITDTAVGLVMYQGRVDSVMVGADRILADGHVFNKIGTFKEAVIAKELGIPFYALAPSSTFDLRSRVEDIIIEERSPDEVRTVRGVPIVPQNVRVYNPVFDVTPPKYVTAIITEKGVIYPPYRRNIRRVIAGER